jgi:hypothetical protein
MSIEIQKINKSDATPLNGQVLTLFGTKQGVKTIAKDRLAELALLLVKT